MPLPEGLVEYTPLQIERMAEELFRRRPNIEFAAPINMEVLVESDPNVELKWEMGLRAKHRVEGCVCKQFMSRQLTVYVDWTIASTSWPEYNAVLAEEFAHMQLHMAVVHCIDDIDAFLEIQRDPQWRKIERDARTYSAAIRMPRSLVVGHAETVYQRFVLENGFIDPVRAEMGIASILAGKFRVPPDDMRKRMADWPCELRPRILKSILSRSDRLVSGQWTSETKPHFHGRVIPPRPKDE